MAQVENADNARLEISVHPRQARQIGCRCFPSFETHASARKPECGVQLGSIKGVRSFSLRYRDYVERSLRGVDSSV